MRCSRCHTVFNAVDNLFQQTGTSPSQGLGPDSATTISGKSHVNERPAREEAPPETSGEPTTEAITESFPALESEQVVASKAFTEEENAREFEPEAHTTEHNTPFEAQHQDNDVDAGGMKKDAFTEEVLHIFADETDTKNHPFDANEPPDKPIAADKPRKAEVEKKAIDTLTDQDEFDADLLSLFDQALPESTQENEHDTLTQRSPVSGNSLLTEKTSVTSATEKKAPARKKSAASKKPPPEGDSWDLFSEENIEALLSANKLKTSAVERALFVEEHNRDPQSGEDEPALTALDDKTEPAQEDETFPSPRQMEQNGADQMEEIRPPDGEAGKPPVTKIDLGEPTTERPSYNLPLEQAPVRGNLFGSLLWGNGIVLMLAVLALQYLYYHRLTLVVNPQLRPVLEQMCQVTGCPLPPRRDVASIELGNHLVQNHPRYTDSLLITATLVNHADFTQPFPIVEVVMTDLDQVVIARRRFMPEQYLAGENASRGFSPDTEMPLMLEVLDPGKKAVGFEFKFY